MLIPIVFQAIETSGSARQRTEPESNVLLEDAPLQPLPKRDQPITDKLLDEMGKALAARLNALVDALPK
ncbi:MAG: hypothetical protein OEM81_10295 [Acidimicrobiia bacterium]|nr:hypothetical protein [Acidimicrobiia bacterium]MDH3398206.1 hypothetical protein [Acidimicrobiia bacterium]